MKKIITIAIILGVLNAFGQSPSFFSGNDYIFPPGTSSVTNGDFNGDGKPDIAATATNGVSILFGNGNGFFAAAIHYNTGTTPASIISADFNNDNILDLAAMDYQNSGNTTISVLLGNGNGTFGVATNFISLSSAQGITSGDFNGDGNIDLAVTAANNLKVVVFLGSGNGTFSSSANYGTGSGPVHVITADFNGDGKLDLATANGGGTVSILLGTGNGTFATAVNYNTNSSAPSSVTTNDFNSDGILDLAVCNFSGKTVSIFIGTGTGTFGGSVNIGLTYQPDCIISGDFNSDGKFDLAINNVDGNNLSIMLGNGNGTFASPVTYSQGGPPNMSLNSMTTADFNMDGKPDLVIAGNTGASEFLGNGDGTFFSLAYETKANAWHFANADFNMDGIQDLVTPNSSSTNVSVMLGNINGSFKGAYNATSAGTTPSCVAIGDFNSDNIPDIAITAANLNNTSIKLGVGDGSFTAVGYFSVGSQPTFIVSGDFNNDGKADLVISNKFSNTISIRLGNGNGAFTSSPNLITGSNPTGMALADFNSDNNLDIAVANSSDNTISIFFGNGNGTFGSAVNYSVGTQPTDIASADFNGDGNPDLAITNYQTNNVSILLGNTSGTFSSAINYTAGSAPRSVTAADFNGDGNQDLAICGNGTILLGNGNGSFTFNQTLPAPYGSYIISPDFNNDGKKDIGIIYDGAVAIFLNSPAPTGSAAQSFCSGASPTVADLVATGPAIKWYAASTGGSALATTTALATATHYYASQTINGSESSARFDVTATIYSATPVPTGASAQSFCLSTSPRVGNLAATGTALKWYAASSGGSALATTTALVNATHYYASQTISGCGESSLRFDVTATVNSAPGAPTGTAAQWFCSSALPTVANLVATGTAVKWYAASSGGSALPTTTALATMAHYFATQTVSGCESTTRFDVTENINTTPGAPTGTSAQSFCSGDSLTLADLYVNGTDIQWYAASSGGSALATTTALVTATHYFATQTVNGCESIARFDVTTTVNTGPGTPTGTVAQTFCSGASVYNLAATGTNVKWYAASSGGTALAPGTLLVTATHYYASQTVSGCESATRFDVIATVNPVSASDTTAITCNSFTWYGNTYNTSCTAIQLLTNIYGCDSTVTLHLTINNNTGDTTAITCNSFTWYGITYNTSGTPTQLLTNIYGCDSTVTLYLTVNTVDTTVSVSNSTLTANATSATYQWINCNGNTTIAGQTNQSFTATANGNYAVIVTQNTCPDTSACYNITTTGIFDPANGGIASTINIYPNPFTSQTTISFAQEQKNTTIKIMDLLGKEIKSINFSGKQLTIEKEDMTKGIYFLQTIDEKKTIKNKKIIIQ